MGDPCCPYQSPRLGLLTVRSHACGRFDARLGFNNPSYGGLVMQRVKLLVCGLLALCVLTTSLEPVRAGGPFRRLARAVNNARPGVIFGKPSYQSAGMHGGYSQPSYSQPQVIYSDGGYQTAQPYQGVQAYSYAASGGGSPSDVGQGTAAYQQCLREAQMQAQRGRMGHILGVPAGCGMGGVGMSHSPYDPHHCTGTGLIARAGVQGSDGRWYWSAGYSR